MNAPQTPEGVTSTITVLQPSEAQLARGPAAAAALAESFVIDSAATYEIAGEELRAIKAQLEKLDTQRRGITRPIDAAKEAVMNLFRSPVEALQAAEQMLKSKMLTFSQAEKRKADAERLEQERIAREERERLAAEAKTLEDAGRHGEAEVQRTVAAMIVPTPAHAAPPPAAKGISTKQSIDFEVVDMKAAIAFIAKNPDLSDLLAFDTVKLRNYVRGLGMSTKIDGVRVFEKSTISARK